MRYSSPTVFVRAASRKSAPSRIKSGRSGNNIGGSDDWTAPGPCVDLAAKLAAAGEAATITIYPDTYHGFDGPSTQPRRRIEAPNGVNPGKGVTVAANPAARDDAYVKLKRYLREHLGP